MTRVTIFCTITSVGTMAAFTPQQVSGHKFVLVARDGTGSQTITVFDHTRDYHHSLYAGQSIMLENVHTSGKLISVFQIIFKETCSNGLASHLGDCVVPEKIHTHPMEGHGKFLVGGGFTSQNFRSKV